jgi:hypothetical protein
MSLGSTQPLTEISFLGCKDGRCVGLTTLKSCQPYSYADFLKILGAQPPRVLETYLGNYTDTFAFTFAE